MPLVGLTNCRGQNVPFDSIAKTYRMEDWVIPTTVTHGPTAHWPLPLLLALARQKPARRKAHLACDCTPGTSITPTYGGPDVCSNCATPAKELVVDSVWVTSLLQDSRRETMKKRIPYFSAPERMLAMAHGSAFGLWLESKCHGLPGIEAERRVAAELTVEGETIEVSGRIDLTHGTRLVEYKEMNVYALKKTVENGLENEHADYAEQCRFYGALANLCDIHIEPAYQLWIKASNWQKKYRQKTQDPQFAEFWVMPGPDDLGVIKARLADYLKARKLPEDKLPPCADREAFGMLSSNSPRRCADYCEVNGHCSWWRAHASPTVANVEQNL